MPPQQPVTHVSDADHAAIAEAITGTPRFVTGRPSIADAIVRSGLDRLTPASPVEDIRDALDLFRAETIGPEWSMADREAARLAASQTIGRCGITNVRRLVSAVFSEPTNSSTKPEPTIALKDEEPAPEPVDGARLLEETAALISRYVVVSPAAARACALWVVAAYVIDALALMPLLLITAPTMRSGKTTLLTLLGAVVPRALFTSNLTGAVLARAISTHRPTLLADEADTWLTDEASELRGIMNAGHTRATAYILRCAPDTHEPQLIPCFGARVLAMIKRPPATILDRSITVELRRRRADEPIDRLRVDRLHASLAPIRGRWRRWALDHLDAIREAEPAMPETLHDRAADNWRPLLKVADLAGGDWSKLARAAAVELSGAEEAESIGVELLADLRAIYDDREADALASAELVTALIAMTDRPWADWSQGRPLTAAKLARLLRPFGIVPTDRKLAGRVLKAYRRDALEDAWTRYVPTKPQPRNPTNEYGADSREMKAQPQPPVAPCETATGPVITETGCEVALSSGKSEQLDVCLETGGDDDGLLY